MDVIQYVVNYRDRKVLLCGAQGETNRREKGSGNPSVVAPSQAFDA
jgi:hypothetical protein